MHAITAGLTAAGLLLCLAMAFAAFLTRTTAEPEDRSFTRTVATAGQAAVGAALFLIARCGYQPAPILRDAIYAAMAAAVVALATRLPAPADTTAQP
jgi:hypothetical protein